MRRQTRPVEAIGQQVTVAELKATAVFLDGVTYPWVTLRRGPRGGDRWYGNNAQTTVFEYDKPAANADHPTMKPVDLIGHMLGNSCPPGGLVLDVFGGSGSTMAADACSSDSHRRVRDEHHHRGPDPARFCHSPGCRGATDARLQCPRG